MTTNSTFENVNYTDPASIDEDVEMLKNYTRAAGYPQHLFYKYDNLGEDKQFVKEAISANPNVFITLGASRSPLIDELGDDYEFMMELYKRNPFVLRFASDRIRQDAKLMKAFVEVDSNAVEYLGVQPDEDMMLAYTKSCCNAIEEFPVDVSEFESIQSLPFLQLQRLSKEVDPESPTEEEVKQLRDAFAATLDSYPQCVPNKLLRKFTKQLLTKDLFDKVVDKNVRVLDRVDLEEATEDIVTAMAQVYPQSVLRGGAEFVVSAFKYNKALLPPLSRNINDAELFKKMAAVDSTALLFAQEDFFEDAANLQWALDNVKNPQIFICLAIKDGTTLPAEKVLPLLEQNPAAARLLSAEDVEKNKAVVAACVKTVPSLYRHVQKLNDDKELALIAVGYKGSYLQYAAASLRGDKEVVMKAIENDGAAYNYASEALQQDKEVAIAALKSAHKSSKVVVGVNDDNNDRVAWKNSDFGNDEAFVKLAIAQDPRLIANLRDERKDPEYMKIAIQSEPDIISLFFITKTALNNNADVALFAAQRCSDFKMIKNYFQRSIWSNRDFLVKVLESNPAVGHDDEFKDILQANRNLQLKVTLASGANPLQDQIDLEAMYIALSAVTKGYVKPLKQCYTSKVITAMAVDSIVKGGQPYNILHSDNKWCITKEQALTALEAYESSIPSMTDFGENFDKQVVYVVQLVGPAAVKEVMQRMNQVANKLYDRFVQFKISQN